MKNKKLRAVLALAIVIALVAGVMIITSTADTSDPTVTYNHGSNPRQFEFTNATAYTDNHNHQYPNLFPDLSKNDLMPGDSVTQTINVGAKNLGSSTAVISLKVEPDGDDIDSDEARDYEKLLQSATLVVKKGADEIASGDLATGVELGTFVNGTADIELTVTLNIPITAGNEIAGLQAAVRWVFTADVTDGAGPGPGPGGGTTIEEPEVPLADLEMDEHYSYIIGRDDGLIHPSANITRAEVATIFFRLLTDESRSQVWMQTNDFSDVSAGSWYNNAISTLSNAGIINGRTDGSFDPNAPITRAEFAALAIRFFGGEYSGEDHFTDIAGHWANDEINRAAERGFVTGDGDGTFRPNDEITRAEAITIVNRVLGRAPHEDHLLDDMKTWPDNQPGSWYYLAVQEATNYHDYDFESDTEDEDAPKYEIWKEILPARDWAALELEWSTATSGAITVSSDENSVYE